MYALLFPSSLHWSHTFLPLQDIQYQLQKSFHASLTCLAIFAWINYLGLPVLWLISLKGHMPNQNQKSQLHFQMLGGKRDLVSVFLAENAAHVTNKSDWEENHSAELCFDSKEKGL